MTNWREKYTIGSQWKCRDGSRAVVVGHDIQDSNVIIATMKDLDDPDFNWINCDGFFIGEEEDWRDLIEPWTEPRVFEDELVLIDNGTYVFSALIKMDNFSIEEALSNGGYKLIARKKITITEGEGI